MPRAKYTHMHYFQAFITFWGYLYLCAEVGYSAF